MPVTLTGEARAIAAQMAAVSPCTDVAAATWRMGDTLPAGDDVASAQVAVGPGFTGSLSMDLVSPASSSGTSSVKMFRRYLDKAGNLLSQADSAAISVIAGTPVNTVLTLTAAPAGTAACEVGIYSNMAPPGNPTRINQLLYPRCMSTNGYAARSGWTLGQANTAAGVPTGITSYVFAQCPSAGAYTHAGLNMPSDPSGASPGAGISVVAGMSYVMSGYIYSAKAGTASVQYRFFSGSTWTAAAAESADVALTASTWTRVSFTFTVPAGANSVTMAWRLPASITYALGDKVGLTCMLLEEGSTLAGYFDGAFTDASIPAPKSSRWEATPNASRSIFYAATKAGGTTVQATDAVMSYGATVEELIGAALERPLRRSVADIWNAEQSLITGGTPGLLQGQLTYLCASLAHALSLDSVYRQSGLVVLDSTDELDGLTHRAVGVARITPERALPGKAAKWLYVADVREQVV